MIGKAVSHRLGEGGMGVVYKAKDAKLKLAGSRVRFQNVQLFAFEHGGGHEESVGVNLIPLSSGHSICGTGRRGDQSFHLCRYGRNHRGGELG